MLPTSAPKRIWREAVPWAVAAVSIVTAIAMGLRSTNVASPELPPLTYSISTSPEPLERTAVPAISPDGRHLAFVRNGALWVRDLDKLEARQLTGTDGAQYPFWSPDADAAKRWEKLLDETRSAGDSVGAIIEVEATGAPAGWGAPIYAKLDAEIAGALMSINAVKGVEIGAGFAAASLTGAENADEMRAGNDGTPVFLSNAAGGILGVKHFEFMGYEDGYLVHTLGLRRDLTRLIRKYRPEVVICFDPTQRFLGDTYANHPDHRASGDAAIDAVFPSARDRLTFPELLTENLAPHKVSAVWMGGTDQPNTWVDITPTLELKKQALLAHPSQLGEDVIGFVLEMGKEEAKAQPYEYAEGFRKIQLEPVPEWKE